MTGVIFGGDEQCPAVWDDGDGPPQRCVRNVGHDAEHWSTGHWRVRWTDSMLRSVGRTLDAEDPA